MIFDRNCRRAVGPSDSLLWGDETAIESLEFSKYQMSFSLPIGSKINLQCLIQLRDTKVY